MVSTVSAIIGAADVVALGFVVANTPHPLVVEVEAVGPPAAPVMADAKKALVGPRRRTPHPFSFALWPRVSGLVEHIGLRS